MKQNDIKDNAVRILGTYQYENAFNVYLDSDDRYFYNLLKNIYIPDDISSDLYTTVEPLPGELLPQLSYRVYNTVNLWWLIAKTNNISNPLEPLTTNTNLKIIRKSIVSNILETIKED